jgi:hypothetical protein
MVKDRFSDPFVIAVKDQLRNVRFHIRRSAQRSRLRDGDRGAAHVPLPVALAADAVFSQVETAATALLPDHARRTGALGFPLPVDAYFSPREPGQSFTYEFYYALKALLRRFGASQSLIFEQAVDDAHDNVLRRHEALVAALGASAPENREAAVARLCAAIALELASARPIKELLLDPSALSRPKHLVVSPNAYCACVLALSTALVSLGAVRAQEPDAASGEIVAAADYAVDARFSRLTGVLRSRDPVEGLAGEFAAMLPFLP